MLAGRGIGPFAGRTLGRVLEPHIHRSAGRVAHVANQPVAALAPPAGEVVSAHRLGLPAETLRKIGSIVTRHHAASRSEMRATG